MKQIATVTRMIGKDAAEVVVARQTACGHDCENCGGCGTKGGNISVRAVTKIPLSPGDRVELYSDNRVLGFAALVYLVPLILFFAGYLLTPMLSESLRYLCGGLGFGAGIAAARVIDRVVRRKNDFSYQIIRKL